MISIPVGVLERGPLCYRQGPDIIITNFLRDPATSLPSREVNLMNNTVFFQIFWLPEVMKGHQGKFWKPETEDFVEQNFDKKLLLSSILTSGFGYWLIIKVFPG